MRKDISRFVRRRVRQRMLLGLLLLSCAALLVWSRVRPAPETENLPLFGYDAYGLPVAQRRPGDVPLHTQGPAPNPTPQSDIHIIGINDVHFLPPPTPPERFYRTAISSEYIEQLMDFTYLRSNIFLEDPSTLLLPTDIDVYEFVNADLRIDPAAPGPHVLLFHTHSTEWFADTNPDDLMTGIVGVGRYLAQVLAGYGLEVLHHTGRFDIVDGRPQVMGSYERMEPVITALLAENPTIQLVIDLHRDGVREGVGPFTRDLDGVPTARLMFFNGLSRRNVNGQAVPAAWLPNPYLRENLQFSLQTQLAANALFPGLNRRIYLRSYRFSLHMHPLSIFVEVGNQYNTLQEAKNAMHPLARILADVVLGER